VVDVREAHEHAASRFGPDGYAAVNVPLSRLVNQVPQWLSRQERVPLVFFCRSGNRSRRAALCLRRSGYDSAFHLAGGVALSGAALRLRHFCIDGERTTVRTK
jgi:rhodanese-related sulfurtransferase